MPMTDGRTWKVMDPNAPTRTRVFHRPELAVGYAMHIASSMDMPITVHHAIWPSRVMTRGHLRSARLVQTAEIWGIQLGDSEVIVGPYGTRDEAQAAAGRLLSAAHKGVSDTRTPDRSPRRLWSSAPAGRR